MKRCVLLLLLPVLLLSQTVQAETSRHYQNRVVAMIDIATSLNDYLRIRLEDKGLCTWAQLMAQTNARAAEEMTPPPEYALLHPHFLLVLMNIERSFHFAAEGKLKKYRYHQNELRKEMGILEEIARKKGLDLFHR